jgi:hypothetical protein
MEDAMDDRRPEQDERETETVPAEQDLDDKTDTEQDH